MGARLTAMPGLWDINVNDPEPSIKTQQDYLQWDMNVGDYDRASKRKRFT